MPSELIVSVSSNNEKLFEHHCGSTKQALVSPTLFWGIGNYRCIGTSRLLPLDAIGSLERGPQVSRPCNAEEAA